MTNDSNPDSPMELTTHLLQQIFDAAPDLVYAKDLQGRYVFLNKAAAHVKGRPAEEVIGKDDTHFFPLEFARVLQRNDRIIMDGGTALEFEEQPVVDGVLRTFISKKAPYWDAAGNVIGLIGISRDITDARNAQEALRRAEARWQAAIDCSGDGIWDWDVRLGEVFYSPRWKAMLGFAEDEVGIGISEWSGRIHPDDAAECWQQIGAHVRGESPAFSFEHRLLAKDGTWMQVYARGRVIERDPDSSPTRMVSTFTDMSQQRSNEETIDDLTQRLQLTHHVTGIAIWESTDPPTNRFDWDSQMYRIHGVSPEDYDGSVEQWSRLLHDEDAPRVLAEWQAAIQDPRTTMLRTTYRVVKPDGQIRAVYSQAQFIRDAAGNAMRILGANLDLTEKTRSDDEL